MYSRVVTADKNLQGRRVLIEINKARRTRHVESYRGLKSPRHMARELRKQSPHQVDIWHAHSPR